MIYKIFALLILSTSVAYADADQASAILDDTLTSISSGMSSITTQVIPYALSLFGILAAIEVAVIGITLVVKSAEMQETVAELAKKIFWFGLILALIYNGAAWYNTIIKSMSQIGSTVAIGGSTGTLGPSGIIESGFAASASILNAAKDLPWDAVGAVLGFWLTAAIIIISSFVASAFIFIAMAESIIVTGVVALMIALGTTRFTSDFVGKSFSYATSIAIKLFFVFIVSGLATTMVDQASANILAGKEVTFLSGLSVAGIAILGTILTMQIPSIAGAALSGAPAMNVGSLTGNAMALGAGGAALAGAMAYTANKGSSIATNSLAQTAAAAGQGASSMGIVQNGISSLGSKAKGAMGAISDRAGFAVERAAASNPSTNSGIGRMGAMNSSSGQSSSSLNNAQSQSQQQIGSLASQQNLGNRFNSGSGQGSKGSEQESKGGILRDAIKGGTKAGKNLSQHEWASKAHIPGIQVRLDV
jgi:type IV secretion system protein TrbL